MSVLIGLPSVLFAIVATEWLKTDDLATFDTACCNSTLRLQLLNEIRQLPSISSTSSSSKRKSISSTAMYQWIHLRGIILQTYYLYKEHFNDNKLQFPMNYSTVTFLCISSCYNGSAYDIINSCTNLGSLSVSISAVVNIRPKILSNLKKLWLGSPTSTNDVNANINVAMNIINDNCKSLDFFSNEGFDSLPENQVKRLLQQNPKLEEYDGQGRKSLLNYIIDNYPNIAITYSMTEDFDIPLLSKVLKIDTFAYFMFYSTSDGDDFIINSFSYFYREGGQSSVKIDFDISESNLMVLMRVAKNITSLEFGRNVSCNIVPAISHWKHSISSLSFKYSYRNSYESLANCFHSCKLLAELKVHDVTNNIIKLFDNEMTDLISLYLEVESSPSGKMSLSTVTKILQKCPNLKVFHIIKLNDLDIPFSELDNVIKSHKCLKDVEIRYEIHQFKMYSYDGHKFEENNVSDEKPLYFLI